MQDTQCIGWLVGLMRACMPLQTSTDLDRAVPGLGRGLSRKWAASSCAYSLSVLRNP